MSTAHSSDAHNRMLVLPYLQQHPAPPTAPLQQNRGDRKLAFGQLRQAVSSRLCDLLDEAGIHATRVVSGRRFVRWDTVPKLLTQQSAYISGLPYEFFFAKSQQQGGGTTTNQVHDYAPTTGNLNSAHGTTAGAPPPLLLQEEGEEEDSPMPSTNYDETPASASFSLQPSSTPSAFHPHRNTFHLDAAPNGPFVNNNNSQQQYDDDDDDGAAAAAAADQETLAQKLIAHLHAQPLNINILSWKKQTISYILDGLDKRRIRVVSLGGGHQSARRRDVVFEMELPGGNGDMVDIPSWPDVLAHAHAHAVAAGNANANANANQNHGNGDAVAFPTPTPTSTTASPDYYSKSNASPPYPRKFGSDADAGVGAATAGGTGTASTIDGRAHGHSDVRGGMMPEYNEFGHGQHSSQRDSKPGHSSAHPHAHDQQQQQQYHQRRGSAPSTMEIPHNPTTLPPPPLVHNHTLTPAPPFRAYHQHQEMNPRPALNSLAKLHHAQTYPNTQHEHAFGASPVGPHTRTDGHYNHGSYEDPPQGSSAGTQHVSRPILHPSAPSGNTAAVIGSTFLTTPTPTKKWTRRSSPDRIFMNVTLNGLLRSAGMPIPRQKDDASRLPWSSIPQFLAENGLYIRGWPEANLPWLYSGDVGRGTVGVPAAGGGGDGGNGIGAGGTGEWRDRIDWKSSPSQRSYKPLAQALRTGDVQILPRPRGRHVLFEVRDAQGRCYDSTLGLSDEWKARWMQDCTPATAAAAVTAPAASTLPGSEFKFMNLQGQGHGAGNHTDGPDRRHRPRLDLDGLHEDDEDEKERGRPGYHSRSTSYSRSGSSRTRNMVMDYELPSPTETTTSTSSGATKRQALSKGFYSSSAFPDISSRVGYQNLAYPSEHQVKPLVFPRASSSFPPNRFHDAYIHPRHLTPPITSYDRDGQAPSSSFSSSMRFPPLLNRQYSESIMRFQPPVFPTAESSNNDSCRSTPSPDSSQRQRTVSLGTSSASTGTGTVLSGSSSAVSAPIVPGRSGVGGRYNLPSFSHGAMDVDIDLDDPNLNRLPPIHFKHDMDDDGRHLAFRSSSPLPSLNRGALPPVQGTSSSSPHPPLRHATSSPLSLPTHLPSPLVAFSQPVWIAAERTWKLKIRDSTRASLPPVGDTIVWDVERRSWKLVWAEAEDDVHMESTSASSGVRQPTALWSAEQEAWILDA